MTAFEGNKYAESAKRHGGALTCKALDWLEEQGPEGEKYMVEAIHHDGPTYFDRLFDSLEEVKTDFNIWCNHTE